MLQGGAGSDTYYVDSPGTTILESPDNSTDTVFASVDYVLSDNLDVLTLTGTADLSATGNALANTLNGNAGNNVLDGGWRPGHHARRRRRRYLPRRQLS